MEARRPARCSDKRAAAPDRSALRWPHELVEGAELGTTAKPRGPSRCIAIPDPALLRLVHRGSWGGVMAGQPNRRIWVQNVAVEGGRLRARLGHRRDRPVGFPHPEAGEVD